MNRFELWIIKRVMQRACIQGDHKRKIIVFHKLFFKIFRDSFSEDSTLTAQGFMMECYREAIK